MTVIYKNVILYYIERHFKKLFTVISTGQLTNSSCIYTEHALLFRWTLMTLHLLRMRRNVYRNVFNDRKNVSATPFNTGLTCSTATAHDNADNNDDNMDASDANR